MSNSTISIADLVDLVAEELRLRNFPHKLTYGPERTQRVGPGVQLGVVFERDRVKGDVIEGPALTRPQAAMPSAYLTRRIGGTFTVYAQSTKPGARAQDHEREVDAVCDGVISAMYRVCKFAGKPLAFTGSRLLDAKEFNANEQWPGAAARVEFTVTVLVNDVDYLGHGPGTGTVAAVHNDVTVDLVAALDDP